MAPGGGEPAQRPSRLASAWVPRVLGGIAIAIGLGADLLPGAAPGLGGSQKLLVGAGLLLAAVAQWIPGRICEAAAVLALSSAVCLASAEAFLWIFRAGERYEPYRAHPTWLWEHIPGFSRFIPGPDGEPVWVRVNRDGHLGPEEGGGRPRVVVYGDSFAAAEEVDEEARFSAQLARALQASWGAGVEVVNAGVRSYGPDQELLRMEADFRASAPDVAVVVLYAGNDFGDMIRNGLLRLDAHGSLVFHPVRLEPGFASALAMNSRGPALLRLWRKARAEWERKTPRQSERDAAERVDFALAATRDRFRRYQAGGGEFRFDHDRFNADVALEPGSESARAAIALLGALLRRMRERAEASGASLVSVGIPFVLDVCPEHPFGRIERERFPAYTPAGLTNLLSDTARAADVPHVDLYPTFAASDGCRWYFRTDDHWNAGAQAEAARLVAKEVLRLKLPKTTHKNRKLR